MMFHVEVCLDSGRDVPRRHHLGADAADARRQRVADRHHRQPGVAAPQARQRLPAEPGRRRPHGLPGDLMVCDLMVCLVTMSTEILFVAFGEWVLGPAACKLIVYGQIVTLASSTFLLTAMSIDRYQVGNLSCLLYRHFHQ